MCTVWFCPPATWLATFAYVKHAVISSLSASEFVKHLNLYFLLS